MSSAKTQAQAPARSLDQRMEALKRAKRDKVTRIRVGLRAAVHKIDIHLGEEVVFLFFARWK